MVTENRNEADRHVPSYETTGITHKKGIFSPGYMKTLKFLFDGRGGGVGP